MTEHHETYWRVRLETLSKRLTRNRFEVAVAADPADAGAIFRDRFLPEIAPRSFSWGDSMTMKATGLLEEMESRPDVEIIRTFEPGVPRSEIIERRRRALLADLFVSGVNAVTEAGQLVNLDMIGNRTGGIAFGPRHVVLFVGRNKIVPDLPAAMTRIREYAAPLNAIRHGFDTPCAHTGRCADCNSPQRICNTWSIMEKSFPPGRIRIVLINADLGL
jgi:hypothetical protein